MPLGGKLATRLTLLKLAVGKVPEAAKGTDGVESTPSPQRTDARAGNRPRGSDGAGRVSPSKGTDSPLDLNKRDWKSTAKRTLKEIKEDRVTLVAAGMAYYFFLSIFPAFLALIGVMNLIDANTAPLVDSIKSALPRGAGQVVVSALQENGTKSEGTALLAAVSGIAVALWTASSGMVALQAGLNIAYDVPEDRKFVGKRAVALLLILATGLLGGVPSPIFTFGESTIFKVIGWIATIAAVSVLFSLFYYLGPKRESPRWQWVTVGGVAGTIIWLIASAGFALYVTQFGNYERTYGPVAGVIILLLWLFLTSISVLVGGELNAEIERQAEARAS